MAIESKNLLVWVKAMSRGNALPLDASEVYDSMSAAELYAASATAYAGQTIKAKLEDGKYHSYTLQPSDAGYVLEEVGAIKESDLKQYVQVVETLPTTGQVQGVLYIHGTDGYIYTGSAWKKVFWDVSSDVTTLSGRVDDIEEALDTKAPIANPVFTGTVKVGEDEVAVKSYVDGLISNLTSDVPTVLTASKYDEDFEVKAGEMFRVAESGLYWGNYCETGDLIIAIDNFAHGDYYTGGDEPAEPGGSGATDANNNSVIVIQANIDGAVSSTADAATVGEIVVFDSVTGKVIKGSGIQIASLNDAIAKAHEHANKAKLDTYDKTQAELLAAAKSEAEGLVNTLSGTVDGKLADKADKATTLAGYGITDAYNKTEIDSTVKTLTDNLNTKISGTDVDAKISTAKTEILEDAAENAASALEDRVGNIPADTTIQSYIDTAVGSGGTASAQAIAAAKQEAITASNSYTDTQLSAALTVIEF